MKRTPNVIIEAIANPAKYPLLYFLILTPLIGIAINGFSTLIFEVICNWLQEQFGINKAFGQFVFTAIFTVLVGFLISNLYLVMLSWLKLGNTEPELKTSLIELTDTFSGLITVASLKKPKAKTTAEIAIVHHWSLNRLRYCWLICSDDVRKSIDLIIAEIVDINNISLKVWIQEPEKESYLYLEVISEMEPFLTLFFIILPGEKDKSKELAHDPNYIRTLVDGIYAKDVRKLGLDESDVIADYTGGTKSMTVGVALACTHPKRRLQYIWSEYDNKNAIVRSEFREVIISYKLKAIK